MIFRELHTEALRLNRSFQVLIITGPRQSGKTTLCKITFPDYEYYNLESPDIRERIKDDPITFLRSNSHGMIIDEAQQLPELFSYIQVTVDENKEMRFVLSGSNNFTLMEKVTQSLAGRAALLTLLPLSINEIRPSLCSDELIFRGFYPSVWADGKEPRDVYSNYYTTYIERDLRQLINIRDIELFRQFMRLMASRVGCEHNATHISNMIGIDIKTVNHWIGILNTSYITFSLPPYYRNIGKRIVKAHKYYFYDTGLVCYLLGIEQPSHVATHPLRGELFENMVVAEYSKRRYNQGRTPHLYYYRDNHQKEIDLIEEQSFDQLHAYEIKSSTRFNTQYCENLDYFKKLYADKVVSQTVLYNGSETLTCKNTLCQNWQAPLVRSDEQQR